MASSYALPVSALPHVHQHHMHSHTRTQSQTSQGSPLRTAMSNGSISRSEDEINEHAHNHNHSLGSSYDQYDRNYSYTSNNGAMLSREKVPPPALNTMQGWTEEKTAGGKSVLTPGPETANMPYSPPATYDNHDHDHGHAHHHDHDHTHDHDHSGHDHGHDHDHNNGPSHSPAHNHDYENAAKRSLFTKMLLPYTAQFPILHAIMIEKDSRRIFYFMTLNFSFMVVQAFYGYVTDSLGLLSDSIHMFFDCVALMVGLLAAVLSKWPRSQKFPYGFGKIETLSGFANGILLMLLSVEIAFEAFERLWEGTHTKRLGELFIVSTLGLIVNLVGMMAFGHHHHGGHDHGHSHGPAHDHDHDHSDEKHDCNGHSHGGHSHGHSHDNDNMHGIYLHILADTLGSVSVIVSTALTSIWGWAGWDPLASCFIAVLIFLSSKPLVYSSARRLLLSVPEDTEYNLRNSLGGILQQRGVVGYSTPKFWLDDHSASNTDGKLLGIVHVVAARGAAMEDVRDRVREYLLKEGMDVVIQVEREGDGTCWCTRRGAPATSPVALPAVKSF
ncbi:hypothetical protein G7046_g5757 [Stylonectria norvegica]|nr:hypothetical protein G7046_g5757 [Stylonectria norvegica]